MEESGRSIQVSIQIHLVLEKICMQIGFSQSLFVLFTPSHTDNAHPFDDNSDVLFYIACISVGVLGLWGGRLSRFH